MSLRTRITLWFTAVLAVALATVGILVYALLGNELHTEVDSSVESHARDTALGTRLQNEKLTIPPKLRIPESQFRAPTLYTEIRNSDWQVVWRSDTLQGSDLPTNAATQTTVEQGQPDFATVYQAGQRIRLYTAPILGHGAIVGYVQVGRNLADIDVTLEHLRLWLLVSSVLVLAIAAGGGLVLSRATLRPIDQITRAARAIGLAQSLQQRLPLPKRPDEVGRLIQTFNEMLDRLESAFLAERRFVADASHELRTPLTTIQGNIEFVRRDSTIAASVRDEALADVADAAAHMSRLVNGLLALARADAGRDLERRPVAFRPIVEACCQQARALARSTDITVDLAMNRLEPGARLEGDPDRLRELLLVILENAVKYNHPGGYVRLNAYTEGRTHYVSIADNGRGIAADDLQHIFERFYRSPRTRSANGSGLGLAIARWIADEHHGHISVQSEVDVGTTFLVSLPALQPASLVLAS